MFPQRPPEVMAFPFSMTFVPALIAEPLSVLLVSVIDSDPFTFISVNVRPPPSLVELMPLRSRGDLTGVDTTEPGADIDAVSPFLSNAIKDHIRESVH